jgi:hypothetical protein
VKPDPCPGRPGLYGLRSLGVKAAIGARVIPKTARLDLEGAVGS